MTTKIDARKLLREEYGLEIVDRDSENPGQVTVRDIAATAARKENVSEKIKSASWVGGPLGRAIGEVAGDIYGKVASEAAPVEEKIDLQGFLNAMAQDSGVEPTSLSYQLSDEQNPLDTTALNFVDRIRFSNTRTDKDKIGFLSDKFGQGNVRKLQDGGFAVKDGEDWKKADSRFVDELINESPVIMGSIAGAKAGAAIGTGIMPGKGTVIGGALGAGLGGAVAKLATLKDAENAGLRTEDDATQVAKEVGLEFIFGLTGELAPLMVKGGGINAAEGLSNVAKKMSDSLTTPAAKGNMASLIQKVTGVPEMSARQVIETPEAVQTFQKGLKMWSDAGSKSIDPATQAVTSRITQLGTTFKNKMMKEYGTELAEITPKVSNLKVDVSDFLGKTTSTFQEMGMVDETGKWVGEKSGKITEAIDPGTLNAFKRVYLQLDKLAQNKVTLNKGQAKILASFDDIEKATKSLRGVLETGGHYGRGESIAKPALAQIEQLKLGLTNSAVDAMSRTNPELAKKYTQMQTKYSKRVAAAGSLLDRMDPGNVKSAVDRYLKHDPELEPAIEFITQDLGMKPDFFQSLIRQPRAALDTWTILNQKKGGMAGVPLDLMGVTSPKTSTRMTAAGFQGLKSLGKAAEFVQGLTPQMRKELLKNPDYMRAIEQTITQSVQQYQQTQEQLLAPLQGGNGQGQGNGGM